jgi:hypothetical protein
MQSSEIVSAVPARGLQAPGIRAAVVTVRTELSFFSLGIGWIGPAQKRNSVYAAIVSAHRLAVFSELVDQMVEEKDQIVLLRTLPPIRPVVLFPDKA